MPMTAMTAGAKRQPQRSGGGPVSRRSTRSAGTRVSCSSVGSAKPASMAMATTKPNITGVQPAGGRSVRRNPASARSSQKLRQPAAQRAHQRRRDASRPSSWSAWTPSTKRRGAPSVFISATESRCRAR